MSERERCRLRRALGELGWSGSRVIVADGFFQRLLGMTARAPVDKHGVPIVMAFPNCRAVHTCGMPYPLDIAFIDDRGAVLELYRCVGPFRMLQSRNAVLVLERAVGEEVEGRSSGCPAPARPRPDALPVPLGHPVPRSALQPSRFFEKSTCPPSRLRYTRLAVVRRRTYLAR